MRLIAAMGPGQALCRCAGGALIALLTGCIPTLSDRELRLTRGCVYYLDGAGGGGPARNRSGGVRDGMLAAGYDGAAKLFGWETGLGTVVDQTTSVEYKRSKAAKLAVEVRDYLREHPRARVTMIGHSAGTAVTAFVLEALPDGAEVENVVFLGASLSANYDLTRALSHVRGRLYVFTSDRDAMLAYLVPLVGTADRVAGTIPSGGLRGFQIPERATAQTRAQYAKLTHIRWTPEFEYLGHRGGHFDVLTSRFVQVCVAPLVVGSAPEALRATSQPAAGMVRNPDYERWSRFGVGSWIELDGEGIIEDLRGPLRIRVTLVCKQDNLLIVERRYYRSDTAPDRPVRVQGFFVPSSIDPNDHPLTAPESVITEMPDETRTIRGQIRSCRVRTVRADREFPEWGRGISATLHQNDMVPGGLIRIALRSHKGDDPFEFEGELVDFGIR